LLNTEQEKTKHAVTPKYLSPIFVTFFSLLSIVYNVRFIKLYLRTYFILKGVKEEKNIPYTLKRRKANWNGHLLRRNCLLKGVTEGRVEGMGRRGRRHKQLLDDVKETKFTGN